MKDNRKEFVFVIGKSSGMDREGILAGYNALVDEQKKLDDESIFSLVFFNGTAKVSANGKSMKELRKYNKTTYQAKGGSALYDAMGLAIDTVGERLAETEEDERPSSVCVIVLGESDTASVNYTKEQIVEKVNVQSYTYKWDFVFYGAEGADFGINKGGALLDAKEAFKSISEYMTSLR